MAKRRKSGSAKRRRTSSKRRRRNPAVAATRTANPRRRRRARVGARRVRRVRARRYVAVSGRGKRMRTYRVRNRHGKSLFRVEGYRARRKNPSTSGLVTAAIAVGAGLAASLVASYVIDTVLVNQSTAVQNGFLVVLAAGTAYFVASPAIAAGVATGLLVVPLAKAVYGVLPSLANPQPIVSGDAATAPVLTAAVPAGSATTAAMSGFRGPRLIGALHRPMGALHRPMGALHRPMGALHQGRSMAALRQGGRRALSNARVY